VRTSPPASWKASPSCTITCSTTSLRWGYPTLARRIAKLVTVEEPMLNFHLARAQPTVPLYSYAEYLERLEASQIRLEFVSGLVYAMAGGTPEHNRIVMRLTLQVGNQLAPPCEPYGLRPEGPNRSSRFLSGSDRGVRNTSARQGRSERLHESDRRFRGTESLDRGDRSKHQGSRVQDPRGPCSPKVPVASC